MHSTKREHFKQTLAACVIVSKCKVFKHSLVQQFVTVKIQFVSLLEIYTLFLCHMSLKWYHMFLKLCGGIASASTY